MTYNLSLPISRKLIIRLNFFGDKVSIKFLGESMGDMFDNITSTDKASIAYHYKNNIPYDTTCLQKYVQNGTDLLWLYGAIPNSRF